MAKLVIEGDDLVVRLSPLEKLGGLSRGLRIPLRLVSGARRVEKPWNEVRGLRVGTGLPFVVLLGRMFYPGGKDFVAIYGKKPAVVVELAGAAPYRRIIATGQDGALLEQLSEAGARARR